MTDAHNILILIPAIVAGTTLLTLAWLGARRRATREDEIAMRRADRAADAAERLGGYDALVEKEMERRRAGGRDQFLLSGDRMTQVIRREEKGP